MTAINELANEVTRALKEYAAGVSEQIEKDKKEVADDLVQTLKHAPSPKLTGDYRKGWRAKKVGKKIIVHNATNYQLTHLLEHGHAKRNGGRTAPHPHIAPAEEHAVIDFLDRIEQAVKDQ
jgi:hypothetical protein